MIFEVQFLALAAQVKADEVTQVFERELSLDLELEGEWTVAVGTGLLRTFTTISPVSGLVKINSPRTEKKSSPSGRVSEASAWSGARVLGSQTPAICRCR